MILIHPMSFTARPQAGSVPVVSIAGRPKVGKTTFLVKLIAELKRRGYRIGVVKHSVHAFDFDRPGNTCRLEQT
jgi:molybdopterin-guanine dinucleotide biosynthesis protein MobB